VIFDIDDSKVYIAPLASEVVNQADLRNADYDFEGCLVKLFPKLKDRIFNTNCLDMGGYPSKSGASTTNVAFSGTVSGNASGTNIRITNPQLDFIFREGLSPDASYVNNLADNKFNEQEIRKRNK
jgi:hypothetical protein